MTKEELEQLKSTVKQWLFHTGSLDPTNYANELKLKFIEPREKQIQIDAEQIRALQNQNGELTDKVRKLEQQIEKMKCDVLSLIKDRMNDDIDQNIIERLAEKWGIKEK